ncbi:hypothetical protein E4631_22565 [Hymenobacter sp. UV11]|uniref:hypothetical protein n=1 Tax=Hymenobacter sp. UV11 TaxID=1849735 RepID=UPI00105F58E5|nr:hypothetical protein [Hymenobacter sp. UV11]TDN38714.1 hypothetical protein A8B98_00180 [Hymenobacter sp. UV11]TFZ63462.1 hypothetical protein E4631_22565 [Hymenobacter sp. UV11]
MLRSKLGELLIHGFEADQVELGFEAKMPDAAYQAAQAVPPSAPDPPAAAGLAAQLRQAQWRIEALHTLIDQAEATYKIDIRKKAGAKPST